MVCESSYSFRGLSSPLFALEDSGEGPGGPGPLIIRSKWGPKGRKTCFFEANPPIISGSGWPPPPPATSYLKVLIRHWFVSLQNLVCYLNTNSLLQSLTHSLRIQPSLLSSLLLIARVCEGRRETAVFAGQLSQNIWWNILGVSLVC